MLVQMAVADAYAAGFEFTDPAFIAANHTMDGYVQHPRHMGVLPGNYTDDTQMALALAELMLQKDEHGNFRPPSRWTSGEVAHAFCNTFRRDPRDGYAKGFQGVLKAVSRHRANIMASSFLFTIRPHSEKNGGAMRAGPIGLYPDTETVLNLAMMQASLTHATRLGMDMAAASALMVHYFHHKFGNKSGLLGFLEDQVPGYPWKQPWRGTVGTTAHHALLAAATAIVESDTLTEVLERCIVYGGDTDTTAAIAVCAASRSDEIAQFLPTSLVEGLENGSYGRAYLERVDAKLMEVFPRRDPHKAADDVADFFDSARVDLGAIGNLFEDDEPKMN
jgi:ADP-ribosyl-[dinitrogen reductase] hydrolase